MFTLDRKSACHMGRLMSTLVVVVTLATLGLPTPSQTRESHKRAGETFSDPAVVTSHTQPAAVTKSPGDQSEDRELAASQAALLSRLTSATAGKAASSTKQDPPTDPAREARSLDESLTLEKRLDEASRGYWNKELGATR
jgi:hypothetical protein